MESFLIIELLIETLFNGKNLLNVDRLQGMLQLRQYTRLDKLELHL